MVANDWCITILVIPCMKRKLLNTREVVDSSILLPNMLLVFVKNLISSFVALKDNPKNLNQ